MMTPGTVVGVAVWRSRNLEGSFGSNSFHQPVPVCGSRSRTPLWQNRASTTLVYSHCVWASGAPNCASTLWIVGGSPKIRRSGAVSWVLLHARVPATARDGSSATYRASSLNAEPPESRTLEISSPGGGVILRPVAPDPLKISHLERAHRAI